ncbi:MAG: glutaredoxin family protein [Pseudomonas sp.]|uniref:glutaredoxin family protein n=1 Tax=Pseudomonas abieticivorans TaxID=2931382 RepID=UPI0020C01B9C|nr:glutaredoxin family protein [Pseudomonas sp. PIA16]MDE1165165.1 glutaredoxin family protein [Pseudomonas sp.]
MLNRTLKRFLPILAVVVLFQQWGKIEHFFNPGSAVSAQHLAAANVTLYSTGWCGYCKDFRQYLDRQGVKYQEFDIEKDAQARAAYEALGGRGIPMLDVNGVLLRQFDEAAILAALNQPK